VRCRIEQFGCLLLDLETLAARPFSEICRGQERLKSWLGIPIMMSLYRRVCVPIAGTSGLLPPTAALSFTFASVRYRTKTFRNIPGCPWFSAGVRKTGAGIAG